MIKNFFLEGFDAKNKQYENIAFSINSGDETEGTRFSEETTNPECKELNWNIKYTRIDA